MNKHVWILINSMPPRNVDKEANVFWAPDNLTIGQSSNDPTKHLFLRIKNRSAWLAGTWTTLVHINNGSPIFLSSIKFRPFVKSVIPTEIVLIPRPDWGGIIFTWWSISVLRDLGIRDVPVILAEPSVIESSSVEEIIDKSKAIGLKLSIKDRDAMCRFWDDFCLGTLNLNVGMPSPKPDFHERQATAVSNNINSFIGGKVGTGQAVRFDRIILDSMSLKHSRELAEVTERVMSDIPCASELAVLNRVAELGCLPNPPLFKLIVDPAAPSPWSGVSVQLTHVGNLMLNEGLQSVSFPQFWIGGKMAYP